MADVLMSVLCVWGEKKTSLFFISMATVRNAEKYEKIKLVCKYLLSDIKIYKVKTCENWEEHFENVRPKYEQVNKIKYQIK